MKKVITVSLMFLLQVVLFAQVPNGGFETWSLGDPDGWVTSNVPGFLATVTQSSDAHSGSSSVKGEVVLFYTVLLGAVVQSGPGGHGFAVSQRYSELKGYFKFAPVGGDRIGFQIALCQGSLDNVIGQGAVALTNAMSSWTEVTVPVIYTTEGTPDLCIIQCLLFGPVTGNDYHVGTVMYADDFSISGNAVDVNDPGAASLNFALEQNYPNPFNPSTTIKYSIPEASDVQFAVYDVLGNQVHSETFYREAGSHQINFNASELSSGIYFYSINTGQQTASKKFVILK